MAPRRKRQRLSEDGAEAVTATADPEPAPVVVASTTTSDAAALKKNLEQRRTLFVRSLAPAVTTDILLEHFSESYPIKHAVAVLDPATKQCKGFGFVTFTDAEDAQRALEELNGSTVQGKKIRVEVAEPRHRDLDTDKRSVPAAATTEAKAVREQQRKEQEPPKLIVRNLPWSIKKPEQLSVLFRSYGKVKYVDLPKKHTGELKGFGFIVMRGKKNAEKALESLDGKEVDGRTIAVDWAVDKETWQNLQTEEIKAEKEAKKAQGKGDAGSDASDAESADDSEDDEESVEGSDSEDEDIEDDEEGGIDLEEEDDEPVQSKPDLSTLFVRNLPFTADDESLREHFEQFGLIRYARIVLDRDTERPKGTGFVSFVNESEATDCLKGIPKTKLQTKTTDRKDGTTITVTRSILENDDADPSGKYTMDGRILQLSRAVDKNEAVRLTAEGAASRFSRDKDKRRLYLLSEGTISTQSPLYEKLSPSEITLRESSYKQRQKLIQSNPSLHLSLTRLSIRNIPRSITSKDLKALARQAIVGFASDVKAGKRQRLNKEEQSRGGDADFHAEKIRKKRGKGIVKQAKIVFETTQGSKVEEATGAGRSRGYGFIEYYTHRNALMALRWLNGHAVDYKVKDTAPKSKNKKLPKEELEDRKKRLIAEFAIENANVVSRRSDRENKAREGGSGPSEGVDAPAGQSGGAESKGKGTKRKRDSGGHAKSSVSGGKDGRGKEAVETGSGAAGAEGGKDGKIAQRSRIIQKKRIARREKRGKA
ncbi:RNA-binding domain-containing protein [Amniculicola lignicola CBS 123094]|uniref:RNA-binding domain-containing protein n=1 Tax=Amniculicola lignicola CBS 123094 TaxID=1392246 RepID=A0A6A5VVL5_9PLEO|nr:RNA-binding domain-containing protein [Amniculicola lignicola CBS 123094]